MSVSAAAVALSIAGTVAAAPAAKTASSAKKPAAQAAAKKKDAPKLSKWQQHIQDMLKTSAPGDEYFGRMKMSYLGINNTFHDDLIRAGAYTTDSHIISRVEFADEALMDWAKRYPNDPQLARSYFLAFQMYRKIWTKEFQDKAWNYAHIVIKKWPSSFFGKALAKDLQIGFTEHYFADPEPCAIPTALPSGKPGAALPSPSPTPIPTPSPTPAPGQPKAEILPAPCIPPATPTPIPTISPVPLPSGSLTPSPAPSGTPSASPSVPSAAPSSTASPAPSATPSPAATPTRHP